MTFYILGQFMERTVVLWTPFFMMAIRMVKVDMVLRKGVCLSKTSADIIDWDEKVFNFFFLENFSQLHAVGLLRGNDGSEILHQLYFYFPDKCNSINTRHLCVIWSRKLALILSISCGTRNKFLKITFCSLCESVTEPLSCWCCVVQVWRGDKIQEILFHSFGTDHLPSVQGTERGQEGIQKMCFFFTSTNLEKSLGK